MLKDVAGASAYKIQMWSRASLCGATKSDPHGKWLRKGGSHRKQPGCESGDMGALGWPVGLPEPVSTLTTV